MVPYNPLVLVQRHARQHDSNILDSPQATPGAVGSKAMGYMENHEESDSIDNEVQVQKSTPW